MHTKTRVLAVDDEPVIAEWLADGLKASHRKVIIATNGLQALSLVAKQKIDVVITDHRMPKSGGLELVRKLRRQNYHGKIVVLSGHLSADNIGVYEELDIDEVVGKPVNAKDLNQIVQSLEEDLALGL